MPYTVLVKIKNNSTSTLDIVEKGCWHYDAGSVWTAAGVDHLLTIGTDSGTRGSGMLRFTSSNGERFYVIVGWDERQPWVNVEVDIAPGDTTVKTIPLYYSGPLSQTFSRTKVEKTTKSGKYVSCSFRQAEGKNVIADIEFRDRA